MAKVFGNLTTKRHNEIIANKKKYNLLSQNLRPLYIVLIINIIILNKFLSLY